MAEPEGFKYDIILAGVGGQGVLSLAAIIALGAMKDALHVRQSEVHGMAQRGGAVLAHLRIASGPIAGDLIGRGTASMVLSMEPLESLRYLSFLSRDGILVTAKDPVVNIVDYPDLDGIYEKINKLARKKLVEGGKLAREAGSLKAVNMVMVGAASSDLPIKTSTLEEAIREMFGARGDEVIEMNIKAFRLGLSL